MSDTYALVLTGEVLPGFAPESVWPQLAAYFRIDQQKLNDLLARAPRIVKHDGDLGKLQGMQAGIAKAGAKAEICTPDTRPDLYVTIDGTPRGPVPHALVEQRVKQGLWDASIQVAETGASGWKPFGNPGAAAAAPQSAPASEPTAAPANRWAPPAAPLVVENRTGDAVWSDLPSGAAIHAGFWRRHAAYMLDLLILMIPAGILNLIPFVGWLIGMIGQWLYFALMESSEQQATLGKRIMGIKVVNAQGERIDFGPATGRYFGKILSGLILCVGYMMAGWTERRQGLHDMMAGTFVVFNTVQPSEPLPQDRRPMPWYGWAVNILSYVFFIGLYAILIAIAVATNQR
jgi:uncharacterized RDD family membrane protein YckC